MNRRQFLGAAAGAALAASAAGTMAAATNHKNSRPEHGIDAFTPFNYSGVRLLPSRFADRLEATRAYYLAIPNDDMLNGFRTVAGLPAPGESMGGWCSTTSAMGFGQWISGMARLYKATGDTALRDKASLLVSEWGKTLPKQTFAHYDYDKFVCGLVDMAEYANDTSALPLLSTMTDWAESHLGRARLNATDADTQGGYFNGQLEWYTLPENLYRAYQLTGDERYKDFAAVWHYPHYWGMFNGSVHATPDGFHAYSHVNTLSSAAMTYAITHDPIYLKTLIGAYDYFQNTQCYATGGYGPGEKLMAPDGSLGNSIVTEPNAKYLGDVAGRSFETPCGTWAVFKLTRYLQQFTGEARYGDWTERVLYNGIGAALPMTGRGRTFYYADYRMEDARKYYFGAAWPCCSGTYIQDVADLHNIIYYKTPDGVAVNMFVPSELTWTLHGTPLTITQTTNYPESEDVTIRISPTHPVHFALKIRVPDWCHGMSARINGAAEKTPAHPGTWLTIEREWRPGDHLSLRVPLAERPVPIDVQHPNRVAYARGPVVLVNPGPKDAATKHAIPFYEAVENQQYTMYRDI